MLISFIVPIYNAESTLGRCVDSLLAQGLVDHSFEIILVNDGSTDGSEELCEEISEKYNSVVFVSQKNMGVSMARNNGIHAACGEYLCFVDSDDCLVPGGIASLVKFCDGNNDLIRYWCGLVYHSAKDDAVIGDGSISFTGSGLDYLRQFGLETFCVNYLYRKEFLINNHLFFTPGIIGEDFRFMFDVLTANPHITSVAKRVYQYFNNPCSVSTNRSVENSRLWVKDLLSSMTRIASAIKAFSESDPILYQSCRCGLEERTRSLFSRSLTAQYTTKEFKAFLSSCHESGILPLRSEKDFVISFLNRFPFVYPLASIVYRLFFLPYIYPHIDRYGK